MGYKICQDLVTSYLLPILSFSTPCNFHSAQIFILFEITLSVVSFALLAMDSNLPSVWKILSHLRILPIPA